MHDTYLKTLRRYYEEEVEGEAYFAALAERFDVPDQKNKLELLAEVERHAADAVRPLLDAYGLKSKPVTDLVQSGQADALATPVDWGALLKGMSATYSGYLQDFKTLEAMGPSEDRAALAFLTAHEVAAIAFLELEAQDSPDSTGPLRHYLSQSSEDFIAVAE